MPAARSTRRRSESLTTLLDTELDRTLEVQMTWLKRESVSDRRTDADARSAAGRTHRRPRSGLGGHAGGVGVVDDVRRRRRDHRGGRTDRARCHGTRRRASPSCSMPTTGSRCCSRAPRHHARRPPRPRRRRCRPELHPAESWFHRDVVAGVGSRQVSLSANRSMSPRWPATTIRSCSPSTVALSA